MATEPLAEFIAGTQPAAVETIARALDDGQVTLATSVVGIGALRGVDRRTAERCATAFRQLDRFDDPSVANAMRVANELRRIESLKRPEIDIVWTGPEAEGPLVRPTRQVIEEMISAVRSTGELLVVGYSLTADQGSPMQAVMRLLGEAATRQALITVILNRNDEDKNLINLLDAWEVTAAKPTILTWNPDPTSPYRSLHAKALVVDRLQALVTSANLTYHGLEGNIELGLRVRGPQAGAIADRFDHLIAAGVFVPWARMAPAHVGGGR